jgi:hypothetical protein
MVKAITKHREETGFSDGSYPVSSHKERMAAIKLRGHSPKHGKEEVLNHVKKAAVKANDKGCLAAIANARAEDKRGG